MGAELAVTGLGVVSSIGHGKEAFASALLRGDSAFAPMRRAGRQGTTDEYLGAEMIDPVRPASVPQHAWRSATLSAQSALCVVEEAWQEAALSELDPMRIGLVVGGSNVQQRELALLKESWRGREAFVRPSYALAFMDTDLCGFCTAQFGIRGMAYTVGGASASGQLAVVHAAQAVASGQLDACIAVGALMDLSHLECQGFRALGAMGSDRFADAPHAACRPFDRDRDGFIFGECSAAIVIESPASCARRGRDAYALLRGWGVAADGNRNPNPSVDGEARAISGALDSAGWAGNDVDYVNPHATGSTLGDDTELLALRESGVTRGWLNATKALTGHGLTAAGTVEVVATLLQMRCGRLHPTRNLDRPSDPTWRWVGPQSVEHAIDRALTLSMGFGGISSALCWERPG